MMLLKPKPTRRRRDRLQWSSLAGELEVRGLFPVPQGFPIYPATCHWIKSIIACQCESAPRFVSLLWPLQPNSYPQDGPQNGKLKPELPPTNFLFEVSSVQRNAEHQRYLFIGAITIPKSTRA